MQYQNCSHARSSDSIQGPFHTARLGPGCIFCREKSALEKEIDIGTLSDVSFYQHIQAAVRALSAGMNNQVRFHLSILSTKIIIYFYLTGLLIL